MSSMSSLQPLAIMYVTWPGIRGTENTCMQADQNWVPHTKEQGEDWVCLSHQKNMSLA